MKIEIEKPVIFSPSGIEIAGALCIGALALASSGLLAGLIGFWITLCIAQAITGLLKIRALPTDARLCAEAALLYFQAEFPDARMISVAVRDADEKRFIISIRYEQPNTSSRPAARRYFAVNRGDKSVSPEEMSRWWPRGLK